MVGKLSRLVEGCFLSHCLTFQPCQALATQPVSGSAQLLIGTVKDTSVKVNCFHFGALSLDLSIIRGSPICNCVFSYQAPVAGLAANTALLSLGTANDTLNKVNLF